MALRSFFVLQQVRLHVSLGADGSNRIGVVLAQGKELFSDSTHGPHADTLHYILSNLDYTMDEQTQSALDGHLQVSHSNNLQTLQKPAGRYARAIRKGRPRPSDTWDVKFAKNDIVEILEDLGRDWYYLRKEKNGTKGTAHGSWLDFTYQAFQTFQQDSDKLFSRKDNSTFITLPPVMYFCQEIKCKEEKRDDNKPDFCNHELEKLLRRSGNYSCKLLRQQRIKWHPDQFAKYCREDCREVLTRKADSLCAMLGSLLAKEKEKGQSK
ncbi:uncharacterized protein EI97DRAFT_437538 [Westerdykella ornata]|uniref:SH3 domain-containing protein n=1 Tax=Westerdykella ornata TaxID=318751 RepID=A0A6A6J6Y8_WESOR|nr:uncharacterized protein EI97DRAFT_437538 [Westerdykella ornata]KAF2271758.1 hypothetical protein EI97DRAFT_437538 [Westerdykella ornata]